MVGTPGTPGTPDSATVREIQELLYNNAERFVEADHASGAVLVRFSPLAALVAGQVAGLRAERAAMWQLLKAQNREVGALRTGLCAVLGHDTDPGAYPGDERVLADLRELAAEARIRENEVISLGCEVEKLERALGDAARESKSAARFVSTMLGGGG